MGANAITMPTNLNITSESDPQKSSITCFALPFTRDSPTANRMAKNTICSTSLCAAASKKLCGTMCSITPVNVTFVCANSVPFVAVSAARFTPTPGLTRFTAIRPIARAAVVTSSKYTIERNASRPTFFMSSPCPAIPTTSVLNSSGTISDLIMRRKIDDAAFSATARFGYVAAGKKNPSATPITSAIMIHWVELMRFMCQPRCAEPDRSVEFR